MTMQGHLPPRAPETYDDPARAKQLRTMLVDHLVNVGDVQSPRVRDALLSVPRHLFVPPHLSLEEAYANRPAPIGHGQTISQPTVIATMTEGLELRGSERILEIGTGSGYQAAVLSLLGEFFPELANRASLVLAAPGYSNVHVRAGDGAGGWPEHAPFDRIIATAAAPRIPSAWLQQLSDPGVLVAPVETAWGQELVRCRRRHGLIERDHLGPVWFVPLLSRPDTLRMHLR
jgi:protein-L-isoaspartate(D-aspartate) O-methyltransferase